MPSPGKLLLITFHTVNQNIVRAKENYFKRAFFENKCNSKKTWNIINDLTSKNRKSSHIHEVVLNGNLINDSNKIADAFNEHFSNIGPKLADNVDVNQNNRCYLDYLPSQNNNIPFQLKETNFSAVFVLLSKLSIGQKLLVWTKFRPDYFESALI